MKPVLVSLTVDVENPQTPLFEKKVVRNLIRADGDAIQRILAVLDKHRLTGSFFTNIYEYPIWGREEMAKLARTIHDAGQEVELHTHPIWVDEQRRENMFQLSLVEQAGLISHGIDFIEQATGRRPAAHRAGAYGFDRNTLKACYLTGIPIDSSNFWGHPNCRTIVTHNRIRLVDGVLEVPVTFFLKNGQPIKTDLDWMTEEDFRHFLDHVKAHPDWNFINLFMHGYSLLDRSGGDGGYIPSPEKEARFARVMERLASDPDCRIVPVSALLPGKDNDSAGATESRPTPPESGQAISVEPERSDRDTPPVAPSLDQHRILILVEPGFDPGELQDLEKHLEKFGAVWKITSIHHDVMDSIRGKAIHLLDPKDLGRHYYRQSVGWTQLFPEQPYYRGLYADLFRDMLALPGIKYWNGHDLYHAGDYNQSYSLGNQVFYLIDLLKDLVDDFRPTMASTLGQEKNVTPLIRSILGDLGVPTGEFQLPDRKQGGQGGQS